MITKHHDRCQLSWVSHPRLFRSHSRCGNRVLDDAPAPRSTLCRRPFGSQFCHECRHQGAGESSTPKR